MRFCRLLALLITLCLAGCAQTAEPASLEPFAVALPESVTSDISSLDRFPRYHLSLILNPETSTVAGRATIRYVNRAPGELREVYLRLYPNMRMYGGRMSVLRASVDGHDVPFVETAKGTDLKIPLPRTLPSGRAATLVIDFSLSYPEAKGEYDFFGARDGVIILPECYPVVAPLIEGEWRLDASPGYGDAAFAEASLYRLEVTAPDHYLVVAPGVLVGQGPAEAGTRREFVVGLARTVGIVAAQGYRAHELHAGSVRLTSYAPAEDATASQAILSYAAAALAYCEENLSPYMATELALVQVPLERAEVHLSGLLLLHRRYYAESRADSRQAVALQVAREWWSRRVASDPLRDPWIDESLASYTAYLFLRHVSGTGGTQALLRGWEDAYQTAITTGQLAPLAQPLSAYGNSARYELLVHSQGPLFWRDLELLLGETGLMATLRALQEEGAFGYLSSAQVAVALARLVGPPGIALADSWGVTPR
ncbi:MAG: hypothetical protein HPY83_06985 [Anaerolineae bacterium]|nr:hypothetical protein [Anaerolineae bacterium]